LNACSNMVVVSFGYNILILWSVKKMRFILSGRQHGCNTFKALKANSIHDLISKTDNEIDAKVYELYGLTEEEVRVVEGG